MEEIGRYGLVELPGGFRITSMDWQAILCTWAAMAALLFLSWLATRKLERQPSRLLRAKA